MSEFLSSVSKRNVFIAKRVGRRTILKGMAAAPAALALGGLSRRVAAQEDITVTMVTDTAGLGDQNFNDFTYEGLQRAEEEFGVNLSVIESLQPGDYVPNLSQAAEQSDLVIATGFLLIDAIEEIADIFPDTSFLLIDAEVPIDNVQSALFREQEGAFLSGVAAALLTETNSVGVLGGMEIPPVIRYEVGWIAGARSVNPDISTPVIYVGSFGDPDQGRESTLALFDQGADIVFPVAGATGIGSYEAAAERGEGFYVVAADTDQSQLGEEFQLGYAYKGVDVSAYEAVRQVVEGEFEGGLTDYGLEDGGVDFIETSDLVTDDILETIERYRQAIINGDINVPATREDLEGFEPVGVDDLDG